MKKVNFFMTVRQLKELAKIQSGLGITFSELMRRIVDGYLEEKQGGNNAK